MENKIITISGNMGVGKTTLANKLEKVFGWDVGYESVKDNPYLEDFYIDMTKWAFHLQMYFLGQRIEQHTKAGKNKKITVLDRSIFEDANIFAKALHETGKINERDYKSYINVFDYISTALPKLDLIIYLEAPVEIMMKRVRQRGLNFDRHLDADYFVMINQYYEAWLNKVEFAKVIRINSVELDFKNKSSDLLYIKNLILDNL